MVAEKGDATAINAVAAVLEDQDRDVRRAAVKALAALKADGSVVAWGLSSYGQTVGCLAWRLIAMLGLAWHQACHARP